MASGASCRRCGDGANRRARANLDRDGGVTLTVLAVVGGGHRRQAHRARSMAASPSPRRWRPVKPFVPYAGDIGGHASFPPSVTNLADPPERARLRIQVAIVFDKKGIENAELCMAAKISTTIIVAFVKTLDHKPSCKAPSGLQNLREDLNERAAVRSRGQGSRRSSSKRSWSNESALPITLRARRARASQLVHRYRAVRRPRDARTLIH